MNHQHPHILNGNQAAAHVAYKLNEVCAIYPITPASEMSELVEEWSAEQHKNIFGNIPSVFEMQSESGVAGAMHGALQTGSLSTTFTASQGLLLMIPNMYKIAAELTPNVIHVATRSVATHALSVFGDHSDVMAARDTGYAFLGSCSVQEAMDVALISQTASLASRIPFVHFFDGFRTSHESQTVQLISDQILRKMVNEKHISAHRERALNPNSPVIRGTSQGPDVFFQSREAANSYYDACPEIVQGEMNKFYKLTGRRYQLFDYVGHPDAEHIIVAMASATETVEETIKVLNAQGERIGLIKVRLFRPFSTEHLLQSIPSTCKSIAVLDRTKEPGSAGEPLYLDVVQSIFQASDRFETTPKVIGGRYGLSSKEFTPRMVKAIVENLKTESPKNGFTVGIKDDVTHTSLKLEGDLQMNNTCEQVLIYETKTNNTNHHFNEYLKFLGKDSNIHLQGYMDIDYKKSNSRNVAHLRVDFEPIKAPYLITNADVTVCDSISFLQNDSALESTKKTGKLIVQSELSPQELWKSLSFDVQKSIQKKQIELYIYNSGCLDKEICIDEKTISTLHTCHLAMADRYSDLSDLDSIRNNIQRIDTVTTSLEKPVIVEDIFANSFLGQLLAQKGNEIPVSALPVDGTFETNTSMFNQRAEVTEIPIWNTDLCTQCGACSMACPQGALRIKAYDDQYLGHAPEEFKSLEFAEEMEGFDLLNYTVQVNPNQCTSCNNCVDACELKALYTTKNKAKIQKERENWNYFETIPEFDRTKIDVTNIHQQQLQEPLFKYAMGVDGCGEGPYLKLASQLFGDRMLIANATGASSIFGGALPTTPWSKDENNRGPAWSNSLFEDNAEFGLGFRLSLDQQETKAKNLLQKLKGYLDTTLVQEILTAKQDTEVEIALQRTRIETLKEELEKLNRIEARLLKGCLDSLVKKSVWIVGGDGWAYDIGYGGLDHVLASGKNVNILVLDNEVYSNTGGQMSKATPLGASAKFAAHGKTKQKKDLGLMAMNYEDVYVASVAIGANQEQTLQAFVEAEKHDGPSLIVAYCHSPAHGIDTKKPSQYQKAAVQSGQWLLYRKNPSRKAMGLHSLQIDSDTPTLPIKEYFRLEKRFEGLFKRDLQTFEAITAQAQNQVNQRFNQYKLMELMDESVLYENIASPHLN
ncbi:MAG: 4Fe-4S binding protein [Bacteroidota bacterium]